MERVMFEGLESREMFSVSTFGGGFESAAVNPPAIHMAAARKAVPTLVGSYSGTLSIPQVAHMKSVVLAIKTLNKKGAFTGTLTASGATVNISGVMSRKGFVITMTGNHPGGPINGTGSGTYTAGYKALKISMQFKAGSSVLPGTLVLTRK